MYPQHAFTEPRSSSTTSWRSAENWEAATPKRRAPAAPARCWPAGTGRWIPTAAAPRCSPSSGAAFTVNWAASSAQLIDSRALWEVDFDPADPLNTPAGHRPLPAGQSGTGGRGVERRRAVTRGGPGVPLDAPWRDVQFVTRNGVRIPVHGGRPASRRLRRDLGEPRRRPLHPLVREQLPAGRHLGRRVPGRGHHSTPRPSQATPSRRTTPTRPSCTAARNGSAFRTARRKSRRRGSGQRSSSRNKLSTAGRRTRLGTPVSDRHARCSAPRTSLPHAEKRLPPRRKAQPRGDAHGLERRSPTGTRGAPHRARRFPTRKSGPRLGVELNRGATHTAWNAGLRPARAVLRTAHVVSPRGKSGSRLGVELNSRGDAYGLERQPPGGTAGRRPADDLPLRAARRRRSRNVPPVALRREKNPIGRGSVAPCAVRSTARADQRSAFQDRGRHQVGVTRNAALRAACSSAPVHTKNPRGRRVPRGAGQPAPQGRPALTGRDQTVLTWTP